MPGYIFFVKLIVSVIIVLIMSVLTEKSSPRLAGIIAGCPTGSLITLFFFGLEISPEFASQSAVFNLAGLFAMSSFLYFYYIAQRMTGNSIIGSSVIAIAGYLIIIYVLQLFSFDKISAAILAIASIPLFIYLFRKIPNVKVNEKVKLSTKVLLERGITATGIILFVTGIAKFVGSTWAGLFSAFPATVFPLILIIHYNHGVEPVNTIIKNFPIGLFSLVLYSLTVHLTYPVYGIFGGTIMAASAALVYLVAYAVLRKEKA